MDKIYESPKKDSSKEGSIECLLLKINNGEDPETKNPGACGRPCEIPHTAKPELKYPIQKYQQNQQRPTETYQPSELQRMLDFAAGKKHELGYVLDFLYLR